ncbi:MAG TPA: hypothetical protein VIP77_03130 [Jiangellaceae bacterium]
MLTAVYRFGRLAAILLAVAGLVGGILLTRITPAAAAGECPTYHENGDITYENCNNDDTEDPGGGGDGGGGGDPECEKPDVVTNPYGDFFWCEGEIWCQGTVAVTEPPADAPPKPSEDAEWVFFTCWNETEAVEQGFEWHSPGEDDPPTLEERAERAYGLLRAPAFDLAFDPSGRTYVGADTTFWVDGPTGDTYTGTEALGLVAEAYNGQVEVDPGDGSGNITCGWAVSQASGCVKNYDHPSVDGTSVDADGQPAHTAQAQLTFDVRFLLNGRAINIPGLDAEFMTWETGWEQTPVPVGEIQVIVE